MKTLVIHPKDKTTDFLEIVYRDIPDKTVVTGGMTKDQLNELIDSHDRIMMMGHGCPYGLFSVRQFGNCNLVVDYQNVWLLANKKDTVFIWCNADLFVNNFGLKGFYSGMFVSEVGEATYCGLPGMKQEDVDESNFGFCEILAKHINENSETIHKNVKEEYGVLAEENPIALYNNNRLYLNS